MILRSIDRKLHRRQLLALAAMAFAFGTALSAVAQTGSFFAVLNEQNNDANGDSQRTVEFFDTTNLAAGPMFAVYMGYEGSSTSNSVDGSVIDVNPANGDIYFIEFDDPNTPATDTINDFDLYRIDFATVFNFWTANHKGQDVRTLVGAN